MRIHHDDRREFWGDIFELPNGDVNVVKLWPGVVIAWHRHRRQDDRIHLVEGDITIQAIDPEGVRHLWESEDGAVLPPTMIPRGWWHGYSSYSGATLLQFNGPGKWDGTDEERMSLDEMPWNPTS